MISACAHYVSKMRYEIMWYEIMKRVHVLVCRTKKMAASRSPSSCASVPEKLLEKWTGKGKDEALQLFQKAFKKGRTPLALSAEFNELCYDLLRRSVRGDLAVEDAAAFFTELSSTVECLQGFPSQLTDLLSILDADVACSEGKESLNNFRSLVKALKPLLGEALLKERLDMDTLEMVGLVVSKANYNQRYVKTKTKLFYKQQKFNLFREESEGYSKLVSELGHERRPVEAVPVVLDNIRSLIGRFNLDPNRVLDVLMEACSCYHDDGEVFLSLLKGYPCEQATFVNILGFKFQSCQGSETPEALFRLAAVFLHQGLVSLADLYPHLSVTDTVLREFYESSLEDAQLAAKKAMVVSLTEKTDEERHKEAETEKEKQEYRKKMLDTDNNQKLGLLRAAIRLGDWPTASDIITHLPPLLPAWCGVVSNALFQLLHYLLEPLYRICSPKATKATQLAFTPEHCTQCHQFSDLTQTRAFDILSCLGPSLHSDPILLTKLLRLGRAFFKEHGSSVCRSTSDESPPQDVLEVFHGFLTALDEAILPAVSLLSCNCGIAEEVWSMLKQLPYERRYELYGRWKNKWYGIYPELMEARTQTLSQGRYIMKLVSLMIKYHHLSLERFSEKRLTKDNVKPSGRMIGKLSHGNPGIIFEYVLSQIQRYDNFIIPVVDSLKYLTPLAYDVLAYVLIEALGHPQKERLKHEDTNISNWLQGLANFSANVFKKYPIELTGLLQYVANQLKAAKSFDLLVLKEVVQKMSGIESSDEITQSQLEALAGGELLKAEGAYFSQVRNTKKSSHRLREALLEADLSLPLCLLMAQQRDGIIYREGANRHLKLACNLYDNCLDTLVQFGGFLSTHLNPDDYNYKVPSLDVLGLAYHIPADAAFFMLRPLIKSSVNDSFQQLEKAVKAEKEGKDAVSKQAKTSAHESSYHSAWYSIVDPIVEAAKQLHPAKIWEDISPKLYTTFWALSLYDLYVPAARYEDEIKKARDAIKDMDDKTDLTSSKRKKEQERSMALIEKLQEEKQRQEDNYRLVSSCLKQEKESWFTAKVTKNRTITQFLQLCIFPRCRFTATDALYCAKFVHMLHNQQTPNFSTLLFLDRTFSDISYSVACCTENEVRRYGRFLGAILEIVSKWHATEALYEQECARTPGFISMMRSSAGGTEKMQYLDYENYRHITFKWHFKLTKALVILLESKDYMQVRNGLTVLTKVLPYYPKVYHLSIALEKRVEKIMEEEKEKRADLYALAIGYAGMLKSHKQNLVPESEFHIREERVKAQKTEGDTAVKPAASQQPLPAPEKTKEKKETVKEKEKEGKLVSEEKPPPAKIPKVKGALTAAEAKAAAEKEKERERESKEKEREVKVKSSSTKAKGEEREESKGSMEWSMETVAPTVLSSTNPELPPAASTGAEASTKSGTKSGAKNGSSSSTTPSSSSSSSSTPKTKMRSPTESVSVANGGNSSSGHHHARKSEGGRSTVEKNSGEKGNKEISVSSGKETAGSEKKKAAVKSEERPPKFKTKNLLDKSDGSSTPGSRGGSPLNVSASATRGTKGARNSPGLNQNGPLSSTATPSPRSGQRRQLSDPNLSDVVPEKETKRRKVEEKVKPEDSSSTKEKDTEKRKRERSSEKDASLSEPKRRKDSPRDDTSSASSSPLLDPKKRVVKVSSKKDGTTKLQETKKLKQEVLLSKATGKKEKEEKTKKHSVGRMVKKD